MIWMVWLASAVTNCLIAQDSNSSFLHAVSVLEGCLLDQNDVIYFFDILPALKDGEDVKSSTPIFTARGSTLQPISTLDYENSSEWVPVRTNTTMPLLPESSTV